MAVLILLAVLVFHSELSSSQIPIIGKCPEMCKPSGLSIDVDKMSGIWFIQYSVPYRFDANHKCMYGNFSVVDSDTISVFFKLEDIQSGKERQSFGTMDFQPDGSFILTYTDLKLPFRFQTVVLTETVFAVIACNDCGMYEKEGAGYYAYIFTREQFPECGVLEDTINTVELCGLSRDDLVYHDQQNCTSCA